MFVTLEIERAKVLSNLFDAKIPTSVKHFQFRLLRSSRKQRELSITFVCDACGCDLEPTNAIRTDVCCDTNRAHTNWIQANRPRVIPEEIFGARAFLRGFVSDCG